MEAALFRAAGGSTADDQAVKWAGFVSVSEKAEAFKLDFGPADNNMAEWWKQVVL